jgi:hypothetical protein
MAVDITAGIAAGVDIITAGPADAAITMAGHVDAIAAGASFFFCLSMSLDKRTRLSAKTGIHFSGSCSNEQQQTRST